MSEIIPKGHSPSEASDAEPADLGFGKGGVPWYLTIYYLAFVVFFVWYVLEYQLPNYLELKEAATPALVEEAPK